MAVKKKAMTRTEFIAELRAMADHLEAGTYHITGIGESATLFANKNYGQIWVRVSDACTINVDLFSATDEEKKE